MALSVLRFGLCLRAARSAVPVSAIVTDRLASVLQAEPQNAMQHPRSLLRVGVMTQSIAPARQYSKSATGKGQARRAIEDESDSDSDSDDEGSTRRGESEFWRRKMRTLHGLLDINKDGVISYDDYKLLANRFVDLGHLSPKDTIEFHKMIEVMWEQQFGGLDRYNLVTTEHYLTEMTHTLNDKSLKKKAHNFLPYLFKAVDKDKSGEISVEEFKLFFRCLGLSDQDAVNAFNVIDKNSDGRLTMKEFVKIGRDFFLTEDPRRPSKFFWGPLIQ